jgi:uncharacterized protein
LPEGIAFLRGEGVDRIDLALDLWTHWTSEDTEVLCRALATCADMWATGLPRTSINWFDEKAARLMGIQGNPTARCGFGDGQIAVAPSGNLYPCERLIGEDRANHPMRLPGHVLHGEDFCRSAFPGRDAQACSNCAIEAQCSTTCRCGNYIRTGDIRRPDGLLCLLDRTCYRETVRVLGELKAICPLPVLS